MIGLKFDSCPTFKVSPGVGNLRLYFACACRLLNKVSKKNVFVLLTTFDFPSIYSEPPAEVASIICTFAAKNTFYSEIYAYISNVIYGKSTAKSFAEDFAKEMVNRTNSHLVWIIDPKTNLDVFAPYRQSLSTLKFIFELHRFNSEVYPKENVVELHKHFREIVW
eukprot:TRINITY_DN3606_c0_g2_i2.p1 TRINITY_DN3606_c0_g2~~TRINITY_DN3606_c0_g2_i2.p1  ORF type:complete len:165 (-),score=47.22 TRINITY_DN3606_c0_g2_i2:451-945(-)